MTWQTLTAANTTIHRWRSAIASWGVRNDLKVDEEIQSHLMTDLDTSKAILRLRAIEKDASIGNQDKRAIFLFADQVLALDLDRAPERAITDEGQQLLEERKSARAAGNWSESDRLRDLLASMGIEVRDGKDGQSWDIRG